MITASPRRSANYPKDSTIYSEGDTARGWFEILDGAVRTWRYFPNGNRQVTGFFFNGQLFGVEEEVYRATAEAITDVVVVRQERRSFAAENGSGPGPDGTRVHPLGVALDNAEARVELLGLKGAQARLAGFLLALPTLGGSGGAMPMPMHRADIADYLAIDVATVSRTLAQFARQGLLSFQGPGRYLIRNAPRLRALAAGARDGDHLTSS